MLGEVFLVKTSSSAVEEAKFMLSYGSYMAKEHPKRGDLFGKMASSLADYSAKATISKAELLKYLGKPDLANRTNESEDLLYFYDRSDNADKWAELVSLRKGGVSRMGTSAAKAFANLGYKPYAEDQEPDRSVPLERE